MLFDKSGLVRYPSLVNGIDPLFILAKRYNFFNMLIYFQLQFLIKIIYLAKISIIINNKIILQISVKSLY